MADGKYFYGQDDVKTVVISGLCRKGILHSTKSGTPQGGLCKASHNEPYAKKTVMQSKVVYTIEYAIFNSFTLHNFQSYFNLDSQESNALSSFQSGRLLPIKSG